MVFLEKMKLPNNEVESNFAMDFRNIYTNYYPFGIMSSKELENLYFEPITILYGGNGSGKTTLLNIIADSINAERKNKDNKGDLFETYVNYCKMFVKINHTDDIKEIKFISSDDIFDYLLDLRAMNSGVNRRKEDLTKEYLNFKYTPSSEISNIDDYDVIRNKVDANKMTQSKYIRTRLSNNNYKQDSNGETALDFWQREIKEDSIYIIDEPENSLSAENQLKLKKFIEESARFYNCQFIIATHSPFLLGIEFASVYDLDEFPARTKKWTDLKNVRTYFEYFMEHKDEFN